MNIYDKTAAHYARRRERELRDLLRRNYGTRNYRLVGREVHVYGRMPNTNKDGFYILGSRAEVEKEYML